MTQSNRAATPPVAVVVGNDLTQLASITEQLRLHGLVVRHFRSATEALEAMSAGSLPSLVLCDVCLTGIDGWGFCRLLRSPEYASFNKVPVFIISATYASEEAGRIASDLGADAFLETPVDVQKLGVLIRQLLNGELTRKASRALIVEDDAELGDLLSCVFEAHGYQADAVTTGAQAVATFRAEQYDVVILDHHLPDAQGLELLGTLKKQHRKAVYLIISGDQSPDLALHALSQGAAAYVSKPFSPQYLVEISRKAQRELGLLQAEERLEARTRELRLSEERFREAMDATSDGLWDWDTNLRRCYISPGYYRMLGYEPNEFTMTREKWAELMHPEDLERTTAVLVKCINNQLQSFEGEYRMQTKAGTWKWILSRGRATSRDPEGRAIRLIGTHVDITERKRVESALQNSERNYREIFDSTNEAIFLHEASTGRLLDVNQAMLHMYGYGSKEEVFAADHQKLNSNKPPYTLDEAHRRIRQAIVEGPQVFEWLAAKKSQEFFWVEVSLRSSQIGGQGRILGVVRDITERKRAEKEKKELQAQLAQAQKMESVGRLAGGVAHDFNNMLMAIQGNVALAMDDLPPDSLLRENLDEVQKCVQRSTDLTRQLLAFARKQTVTPKVLDLNKTVEGMLKMLRRLIGEDIDLTFLPGSELWPIRIDPSQIDQILANLCVNARDAIDGVGKISISTANVAFDEGYIADHADITSGEYILLGISDSGCGMDKDVLEHLFEPFFTTKGLGQGTGLGLATVYGIVKQNNGFIDVDTQPGRGTTLKIHLPRHLGNAAQGRTAIGATAIARGKETILIVEDESAILKLAKRALELLGYTVLAAEAPAEAIHLAEQHRGEIHLMVSDVIMPEMNGQDLVRRLLSIRPTLKTLFMSGYTADVIAPHGVLKEGTCFIQKPFSTQELAAKVREALTA